MAFNDSQGAASFAVTAKQNTTTTNSPQTVGLTLTNIRLAPDEADTTLVPTNLPSASKATLTLLDNDATNVINFQHYHYFTREGNSLQISVILSKATKDGDDPVSVDYSAVAVAPATTAGSDSATEGEGLSPWLLPVVR